MITDTNTTLYGGHMNGYSHQFVAENKWFYEPNKIMKLYDYDEFGNKLTTFTMVDVPTYFKVVDTANGRPIREIRQLKGATHSHAPFNTDENKGEFTEAVANIEAMGVVFGGNDFTLTGNVAFLPIFDVFQNKFQYESPLNQGV